MTIEPEEREYQVTWVIDVSGYSPEDAAAFARQIQLDPTNVATFYTVVDRTTGVEVEIDLGDECPAGGAHTPTNASSHPDRMTDPYWHCDECSASLPTPEREY